MTALSVDTLAGRMLDADSHLYMEPQVMAELLEPIGRDWIVEMLEQFRAADSYESDRARAAEEVWKVKGLAAFGAFEPEMRVQAMDRMGIARQLAFPNTLGRETRVDTPEAWAVLRAYNEHALEWTHQTGGRSIGVCALNLTDRERALAELRRVIDAGARSVCLSFASPPAGTSPANPLWDELWESLSAADVGTFIHLGACGLFSAPDDDPILAPRALWDSPTLRSAFPDQPGAEERIGPVWTIMVPILLELVLVPIIMGGVFERFPRLRLGLIEFGAQWLGPLVERMDMHADLLAKVGAALPLRPSEYVERNIRCTPFPTEPIDRYIDRYGLEGVYCFSTDFPHIEGGRDPVGKFLGSLGRLGDEVVEDFFVENAKLLFPS